MGVFDKSKRALFVFMLAMVAVVSLSGCIWVPADRDRHEHHDRDWDHDHGDHDHDEDHP